MCSQMLPRSESHVRARRIEIGKTLVAESRTLGTPLAYVMPTANVSRTGILLTLGRNRRVPFIVNTLVEVTVDPAGSVLERPIQCIGRVVRVGRGQAPGGESFGVQIVQMDQQDQEAWNAYVGILEQEQAAPTALPDAG